MKVIDRDLGWNKFVQQMESLETQPYAKVGVLADGKGAETEGSITLGQLAAIHEFGTQDGHIPARSFVRSTFDEKREELQGISAKLLGKIVDGNMTPKAALDIMGLKLATDIKLKVTSGPGIPPQLKPATIAAKGSTRPLIDTGRMIDAVTWSVENVA